MVNGGVCSAGRAGRDDLPSCPPINKQINTRAHMFYNCYDTSKASYSMREYVKPERCKTDMVMSWIFTVAP